MSSLAALSPPAMPVASADSTMLASAATISTHVSATAAGGAGVRAILIG
jgi:hypothetical protein